MTMLNEQIKTGWLSPTGEFHPCPVYDHIYVARKLTNQDRNADEILMNQGWVQITISQLGRKEWRIYWSNRHSLSPEQKSFLEPYFAPDSEFPMDEWSQYRWEKGGR